jgi:REP element-mobilizing transposase RayT
MTIARKVVPGTTYLISRRCTQRQHLLRPEPMVEQIYLYCLGDAAERYDITLHGFVAMSNHQHLVVRDNHGNFPEFLAHFHKMVAKAVNALRGRWENLWATEQPSAVHLVEAGDRFDKLVYLLANPVADHLVDRLSDWPGASSYGMTTRTVRRPRVFFRENGNMPDAVTLRIERPEGFEDLSEDEWVAKLGDALRRAEESARDERRASGRGVLGRKAILRAEPTDSPQTTEPRRGLRPQIACLNRERRIAALRALLDFRAERRAALLRFLDGERDVVFPHGTYRVRILILAAPPPVVALSA